MLQRGLRAKYVTTSALLLGSKFTSPSVYKSRATPPACRTARTMASDRAVSFALLSLLLMVAYAMLGFGAIPVY